MAASVFQVEDYPRPLLPVALLFAIGTGRIFLEVGRRGLRPQDKSAKGAAWAWKRGPAAVAATAALCCHFMLPAPSIVPFWNFVTRALSWWHGWLPAPSRASSVRQAFLDGPLGPGASKAVSVLAAVVLWRVLKEEWPDLRFFGDERPGPWAWGVLAGICLGVNAVLRAWSRLAQSRGSHGGVDRMVAASAGRRLDRRERLLYASLALANASCEEIAFRHFWMAEFAAYLPDQRRANLAQAAVFGVMHYYGIPSGLAGVFLTFVYGWIMGLMMDCLGGGGLFLPILAHTVADYYIFSSVARGEAAGAKKAKARA